MDRDYDCLAKYSSSGLSSVNTKTETKVETSQWIPTSIIDAAKILLIFLLREVSNRLK